MENLEILNQKFDELKTDLIEKINTVKENKSAFNAEVKVENTLDKSLRSLFDGKAIRYEVTKAVNVEGTDNLGGYLVPQEYGTFLPNPNDFGLVRKNGSVVPMSRDKMNMPYIATDLIAYTPGEYVAGTTSNYVFGNLQLDTNTFVALAPMSKEFIQDSAYPVAQKVTESLQKQFSGAEDALFVTRLEALGVNQGVTGSATGSFVNTVTGADVFAQLISKLDSINLTYGENGVFLMHPSVYWQIAQFKDSNQRPLVDITAAVPVLMGKKIILTNKMTSATTTTGGKTIIAFGNIKEAYLGDRMGIELEMSTQAYIDASNNAFTQNGVFFKGTERADVQINPYAFVGYRLKA